MKAKSIKAKMPVILWLRYLVQAAFLAFIAQLVVRAALLGESAEAAVPSAEAYCAMGGLETFYSFITTGGKFLPRTHLSNLVTFLALMATVLVAKSAFCGWVCPFGTLQEWVRKPGRWLARMPFVALMRERSKKHASFLRRVDRVARYGKYLVLAYLMVGTISFGTMVFRGWDPYAALIKIYETEAGLGLYILILIVALSLFVERPWCRYACPLGAAIGLIGRLSMIKVTRHQDLCTNCGLCSRACPMDVELRSTARVTSSECHNCLSCLEVCPREGALDLRTARLPQIKWLTEGKHVSTIGEGAGSNAS